MMRGPVLFGLLLGLSPLFGIASAEETALDLVALKNAVSADIGPSISKFS